MIDAMSRARWPNDRIKMTANFWSNLTVHPFRSSGNQLDKNTLLLYQGEQRKPWHQAISSPGHRYDLSRINEQLLTQTKDRLYWKEQERIDAERDNMVSNSFVITILNTTNPYYPPLLLHFSFISRSLRPTLDTILQHCALCLCPLPSCYHWLT